MSYCYRRNWKTILHSFLHFHVYVFHAKSHKIHWTHHFCWALNEWFMSPSQAEGKVCRPRVMCGAGSWRDYLRRFLLKAEALWKDTVILRIVVIWALLMVRVKSFLDPLPMKWSATLMSWMNTQNSSCLRVLPGFFLYKAKQFIWL